jgi:imidazolonepropionase-like amidohydrolase
MPLWETIIGAADLQQLLSYPELKYMPPRQVEGWRQSYRNRTAAAEFNVERAKRVAANRVQLLRALHEGGVRVLLGSDAPQEFSVPGFSIHREMSAMLRSGISTYEVIRSGTKEVGEYFKDEDKSGMVAPGHRADLILVNGDPLKDLAKIADRTGVMVRGRWLPEGEIQERLKKIAAGHEHRSN